MPPTLTFLHTSPVHIETFDALLKSGRPTFLPCTSSVPTSSPKPAHRAFPLI